VNASWRLSPELKDEGGGETPFEKAWADLLDRVKVLQYLARADKLAGIGQYSVLFLGFGDGLNFDLPVRTGQDMQLLYLFPYIQKAAGINSWVLDTTDPRYGLPLAYKIDMQNAQRAGLVNKIVHHSRVLHISEGLLDDDVYGLPKLEPVLNRLQDLEMLSGGSAEMFWRGAFPGISFELDAEADAQTLPVDDIKDEIESYIHGLKRYLRLQGITAHQLNPNIASPEQHISAQLKLISGSTGIPLRILIGSERGELASTQDQKNWLGRVDDRRRNHCEPMILRPFIDRMIEVGVLPEPKEGTYSVDWPELFEPGEGDAATVAKTKTEALAVYSNASGADMLIPPSIFFKLFLGLTPDQIQEIEEAVAEYELEQEDEDEEDDDVAPVIQPTIQPVPAVQEE